MKAYFVKTIVISGKPYPWVSNQEVETMEMVWTKRILKLSHKGHTVLVPLENISCLEE